MPRKNEDVTHVRIDKKRLPVLDNIRVGNETNRKVLDRILEDYDYNGIRRELVKRMADLQLFVSNFIHEDLHYPLETLKAIIIRIEKSNNKLEKAVVCGMLKESLEFILSERIDRILKENNPDKK